MKYKDGEPCDHPGCLHHITHPCEGCGRIAGRPRLQPTIPLKGSKEWELQQRVFELSKEAGFYRGLLEGLLLQCHAEGNWYTLDIQVYRRVKDALAKAKTEVE